MGKGKTGEEDWGRYARVPVHILLLYLALRPPFELLPIPRPRASHIQTLHETR